MKVRATTCFSGLISMYAEEVREVEDSYILNDLMKAGYVVPAEAEAEAESRNPQTNSCRCPEALMVPSLPSLP